MRHANFETIADARSALDRAGYVLDDHDDDTERYVLRASPYGVDAIAIVEMLESRLPDGPCVVAIHEDD